MILECIAGGDFRRRFPVDNQPRMMGHPSLQPQMPVQDLPEGKGYLTFTLRDGVVSFDAATCLLPVYLNNQEVRWGELRDNDVLRIRDSLWRAAPDGAGAGSPNGANPGGARFSPDGLRSTFNGLIGLRELHDFKLSQLFSEVFKKHTREQMEEQLLTGTSKYTPYLESMDISWGKPWLFARLLGLSALLAFVLYAGYMQFQNDNLIPGLIFMGAFAVPVSTLIFFLEMNVPRNVSIFMLTQLMFVGGVASIFLALIFFSKLDILSTYLGASAAGIIEESAKILIVIALVGRSTRYPWILNGLLFGAAVGTGFGAFESAGYAFRSMLSDGLTVGVDNIVTRALLAPFMHIVWTANVSAALWRVKKNAPFRWGMLKEPAFLRILLPMMAVHMIWNAPFQIFTLPFGIDVKHVLLGLFAWMICLRLIQAGIDQLREAKGEA